MHNNRHVSLFNGNAVTAVMQQAVPAGLNETQLNPGIRTAQIGPLTRNWYREDKIIEIINADLRPNFDHDAAKERLYQIKRDRTRNLRFLAPKDNHGVIVPAATLPEYKGKSMLDTITMSCCPTYKQLCTMMLGLLSISRISAKLADVSPILSYTPVVIFCFSVFFNTYPDLIKLLRREVEAENLLEEIRHNSLGWNNFNIDENKNVDCLSKWYGLKCSVGLKFLTSIFVIAVGIFKMIKDKDSEGFFNSNLIYLIGTFALQILDFFSERYSETKNSYLLKMTKYSRYYTFAEMPQPQLAAAPNRCCIIM